jgi:hypothetical protein
MVRKRTIAAALACSALIAAVAVSAGPAGGSPTAGDSQARVLFPGNCRTPSFKPRQVTLACADAGFVIRSITWSSWTTRSAGGKGTASVNDCDPNCAAGTFQSYPASVKLITPELCRAGRPMQFTRIVVTFTGSRPAGFTRTERQHFGCNQD